MIVKGIALTALVASTPFALFATQEPQSQDPKPAQAPQVEQQADEGARRGRLLRAEGDLQRARAELKAARTELQRLRGQLNAALDRLDGHVAPERERDCSPSRSRMLMSHYQWLRDQGHRQRADAAVAKIVERVGDDANRLNSVAWDLMTDKDTAGKYDELALAMARRMEQAGERGRIRRLSHSHLDTVALAHFLNGAVERAIELQQRAISRGGSSDDYRRRLRTYQAAQLALQQAKRDVAAPAATMVASREDE